MLKDRIVDNYFITGYIENEAIIENCIFNGVFVLDSSSKISIKKSIFNESVASALAVSESTFTIENCIFSDVVCILCSVSGSAIFRNNIFMSGFFLSDSEMKQDFVFENNILHSYSDVQLLNGNTNGSGLMHRNTTLRNNTFLLGEACKMDYSDYYRRYLENRD